MNIRFLTAALACAALAACLPQGQTILTSAGPVPDGCR